MKLPMWRVALLLWLRAFCLAADDDPPLCLPHNCSRIDAATPGFAARVAELRADLAALGAPGALPPYSGHRNGSRALLMTMGGPPRAESIVQAFVAIAVLRGPTLRATLPVEVWHAGEDGAAAACALLARRFAPLACVDARAAAAALRAASPCARLSRRACAPAEGWLRGFPIKALALLLTAHDHVLMLDADVVVLREPERAL